MSIARTAQLAECSIAQVNRVTALHRVKLAQSSKVLAEEAATWVPTVRW